MARGTPDGGSTYLGAGSTYLDDGSTYLGDGSTDPDAGSNGLAEASLRPGRLPGRPVAYMGLPSAGFHEPYL